MKKIHIRKPDIKGLSVKVRNLKFKDIKEHYKARKERRQKNSGRTPEQQICKENAACI